MILWLGQAFVLGAREVCCLILAPFADVFQGIVKGSVRVHTSFSTWGDAKRWDIEDWFLKEKMPPECTRYPVAVCLLPPPPHNCINNIAEICFSVWIASPQQRKVVYFFSDGKARKSSPMKPEIWRFSAICPILPLSFQFSGYLGRFCWHTRIL